jgi:putative ABC transport system substrate-binding protein
MTSRRAVLATLGALLAAPRAAGAQPIGTGQHGPVRRIGLLAAGAPSDGSSPLGRALLRGLAEHGYVEGRNLVIEGRYAEGRPERLVGLAAELVRLHVELILVAGPQPLDAARAAAKTIPIVMIASSSDPVSQGIVASLGRPGGNITGLTYAASSELAAKQLEVLKEAVPTAMTIGVLSDVDDTAYRRGWAEPLRTAAARLHLGVLPPTNVRTPAEYPPAFRALTERKADALLVILGSISHRHRGRVAELAMMHRLPSIASLREFASAGGLLSYGPDLPAIYHRAAAYVDRILRGARAADLPVEQPTRFELVINFRTARALGLTIPPPVLARADEIIE